jgi:hypothetical protein
LFHHNDIFAAGLNRVADGGNDPLDLAAGKVVVDENDILSGGDRREGRLKAEDRLRVSKAIVRWGNEEIARVSAIWLAARRHTEAHDGCHTR